MIGWEIDSKMYRHTERTQEPKLKTQKLPQVLGRLQDPSHCAIRTLATASGPCCRRLPATRRHVPIASNMDPERVRAYLQVACAGLGFDIGEVWFTSNENGSSTVAQIGTLSLLLSSVLCVRFIASCSPKDSQDRSLLLFSHVT